MDEYTGSCRVLSLHPGNRTIKFTFEQENSKLPVFRVIAIADHFTFMERDCSDVLNSLYIHSFDHKNRSMNIFIDQLHKNKIYILCNWPHSHIPSITPIIAWSSSLFFKFSINSRLIIDN